MALSEERAKAWLIVLLVAGTAGRLALAFVTDGNAADLANSRWALDALRDGSPLNFYADMDGLPRWPYLIGFAPWLFVAGELDERFGHFDAWLQVAPIIADAVIAVIVFRTLQACGAAPTFRLAGVALVVVGPAFFMISGYAFQIDSVAVVPGLLAVLLWERETPRRALWCGLLAGAAIALKPPLAIVVLAMLPTLRSAREGGELLGAALAIPALLLVPFLLAEPTATVNIFLDYSGLSGQVGLTALIQPSLQEIWLQTGDFDAYDPVLKDVGGLVNAAVLLAGTAFGVRCRMRAVDLSALLALGLWTLGAGMTFAYLIWGLPFLLVRARLALAAGIQAAATLPLMLLATSPTDDTGLLAYRVSVVVLSAIFCAAVVQLAREALSRARGRGARARPPAPPSPR